MKTIPPQLELNTLFAQAQRIAAALCEPVGPRELLLAAVSVCPRAVVDCARERGIELRRVLWALREWGPINAVDPALAAGTSVTPAVRDLMARVANSGSDNACKVLVDRLLDPATLCPDREAAPVESPAHDLTGMVLSRLKLI